MKAIVKLELISSTKKTFFKGQYFLKIMFVMPEEAVSAKKLHEAV